MANKLRITRDQLSRFLPDHESVKQFEQLFDVVEQIAPDVFNEVAIAAGSAQATALNAIAQIIAFSQDADTNSSVAYQKAIEALEGIASLKTYAESGGVSPAITQALEEIAILKQYAESGGVMPPSNQAQKNQEVLAWLSM